MHRGRGRGDAGFVNSILCFSWDSERNYVLGIHPPRQERHLAHQGDEPGKYPDTGQVYPRTTNTNTVNDETRRHRQDDFYVVSSIK